MSKKKGNDYFSMLEGLAEYSGRAAEELERILLNFNVGSLDDDMKKLHAVENKADEQKHALIAKLMKEFITPIEREDIMAITEQIDDVTDAVEDVLLKIYMYGVRHIRPEAMKFAEIIKKCSVELLNLFKELKSFKKPKALLESIIEINQLEEQGDELYIHAVRSLYLSEADAGEKAVWAEIYGVMETVCDTCEHVADSVEHVVMKNT